MTSPMKSALETRAVAAILATIHERWIQQMRSVLVTAPRPIADTWPHCAAARYMEHQFADGFRLEAAFAMAIQCSISSTAARRLAIARLAIESTRNELLAAEHHLNSSPSEVTLTRRLLEEVGLWCLELECATAQVTTPLPAAAWRLLARLRVAHAAQLQPCCLPSDREMRVS